METYSYTINPVEKSIRKNFDRTLDSGLWIWTRIMTYCTTLNIYNVVLFDNEYLHIKVGYK